MLTRGIRPVHEQAWITLAFVLLGVLLAWEFAGRILSDDLVFLEAIALAVVGCVGVASILRNWRLGFCFFNVWLLFEDLFRKYMGNSTALFFGKDVLAVLLYGCLLFAIARRKEPSASPSVSG